MKSKLFYSFLSVCLAISITTPGQTFAQESKDSASEVEKEIEKLPWPPEDNQIKPDVSVTDKKSADTVKPVTTDKKPTYPSSTDTITSPDFTRPVPKALKPEVAYQISEVIEGRKAHLEVSVKNVNSLPSALFPLKGFISYVDRSYDLSESFLEAIPFEIGNSGKVKVPFIIKSPGQKEIKLFVSHPQLKVQQIAANVQPFKATIFPAPIDGRHFDPNPQNWKVYVNLFYNGYMGQRQYYQVTYKGEIVQRLLTSAARAGHSTPQGTYRLGAKHLRPKSSKYNSVMPYWMTIITPRQGIGNYGNHGLLGESYLYRLGTPASHGCVRLSNKILNGQNIGSAKWVYHHVPSGTSMTIFKRPLAPFQFEDYRGFLASYRGY